MKLNEFIFTNINNIFTGNYDKSTLNDIHNNHEIKDIKDLNDFKVYSSKLIKEFIIFIITNDNYYKNDILKLLKDNNVNIKNEELKNDIFINSLLVSNEFNNLIDKYSKEYLKYIIKEKPENLIKNFSFFNDYLNWEFDVNVFKLLGSQLISDKFTAIIELVKNAYDANATEVKIDFIDTLSKNGKIIISDNGLGMSKNDINTKWMRIGTNNKRKNTHTPKPFNRIYLGEKGIGRFAIEKIADYIILESKEKDIEVIHRLIVDWSTYEESSNSNNSRLFTSMLNKYELSYANQLNNSSNGTTLTFENLKEKWTKQDIKRLKRELAKLVSPIKEEVNNEYSFKIFVKEDLEKNLFNVNEYEEIINSSLLYASNIYKISYNQKIQEELHFNEDKKEIEILENEIKEFGPIKIHIYYFNSTDKKKFKLAYKAKDIKIDGFKIYRDSMLATPFVEIASIEDGVDTYRDILGIDKRRWSNFFGKISSHDFIGIIEISKELNPQIKDLTNRQDFEDTKEYKEFKKFVLDQLIQIEKKLDYEKKKERNKNTDKLENAQLEIQTIRNHLDSLSKKDELKDVISPMYEYLNNVSNTLKISNKEIQELNQTIEKKDELYYSLMSLQEYAADLAHMVRNSLDKILGISKYFLKFLEKSKFETKAIKLDYELSKMREDVEYMLNYAESGQKLKKFDLSELILKCFDRFSDQFNEEKIHIELSKPESFIVTHIETFMRDIFNNLISNARRSLKKVKRDKKIIKCSAYKEEDKFIIIFSDNGTGIKKDIQNKIYDRYFSTNKENGGSGIGLYVVKNNLKTLNGKIELIENEFKEGCTFKIEIPIKKVNND